ncbi:uncharacterized protein N7484_010187 [Penicillium longicatenatum]|uniref:uncharacterized protein n=1 Tax=Penicillium longicatenatum TaxID=1561947 RepID=UPI0025468F9B|nr:uncharacterized protein N7484_010187 [Penicillium longicatenatum]KAJ5636874.1 hypothetical protein N7484_010187 [Penicillium longicatenatum]
MAAAVNALFNTARWQAFAVKNPPVLETFEWCAANKNIDIRDVEDAFGLRKQSIHSRENQPWPPHNPRRLDLPETAKDMLVIVGRYMHRSAANEAAARCIINIVLFAVMDTFMGSDDSDDDDGMRVDTWPLNIQAETSLESQIVMVDGKKRKFRGLCDYSLWYGDRRKPEEAIHLVVVEAKRTGVLDTGFSQTLIYMGCIHQERLRTEGRSAVIYGVMSDGVQWKFIRINQQGEHAMKVYDTGEPGGYTHIATTLAFMMQEAVTLSPYASKNHSKEASREE